VSVWYDPATGRDGIHSFRWQHGVLQPVSPTYGSDPKHRLFSMNVRGLGVGERGSQPTAWDEGVTLDLPGVVPGGRGQAFAVNSRGDVVGWVGTPSGEHAALWRRGPAIPAVAAVPSP